MPPRQGQKLFVMDPRGQVLDRYATASLNFTPGSDIGLLNGILHTIIDEKLYDEGYGKPIQKALMPLLNKQRRPPLKKWR